MRIIAVTREHICWLDGASGVQRDNVGDDEAAEVRADVDKRDDAVHRRRNGHLC